MPPLSRVDSPKEQAHFGTEALTAGLDRLLDRGVCRGARDLPTSLDRCKTAEPQVTTALLLAAGAGSRLRPWSSSVPKCLTHVGGKPILGRLVSCLIKEGFERLVVVVGHRGEQIRDYLESHAFGLQIHCIDCQEYATTNNIYSLWLARKHIQAPVLLLESDLVFESRLLGLMRRSNRIAVARLRSNMHGTTVSLDDSGRVLSFRVGAADGTRLAYKTVNLYSLSLPVWQEVSRRLEQRIAAGRVDDYYEVVFAEMAAERSLPLQAVHFDAGRWCEIDTPDDLVVAERLFSAFERTRGPRVMKGSLHLDRA